MTGDKKRFVTITIDGPAGAGKSTVARRVAEKLGFEYLDTGALYRAVTLYLLEKGISPEDSEKMKEALDDLYVRMDSGRVFVNEEEVTAKIRSVVVERSVSDYAKLPLVREKLLKIQEMEAEKNDIVADGRDMGTTVFPRASLKIYLVATPTARALRRWKDLTGAGVEITVEEVKEQVRKRDTLDTNREQSPLRVPSDAKIIDTSEMEIAEVVAKIMEIAEKIRRQEGEKSQ